MPSSLPRLRTDLIVRTQQTSHETFVIVKDPVSRKFFRIGEAEQFIAEQLDGKTPLEVIRQRVEVRFGGELPMEALNGFLQNLKQYGFLETEGGTGKPYREPPRFRGSALYCRFKVFDPCELLKRLVTRTGDRKSTRLNSSHRCISYAVFCLKKKSKYGSHTGNGTGRL